MIPKHRSLSTLPPPVAVVVTSITSAPPRLRRRGFLPGMTPRGVPFSGRRKRALGSAEAAGGPKRWAACERRGSRSSMGSGRVPCRASGDFRGAAAAVPGREGMDRRRGGGRGREPRPHGTGEGIRPHPVGRARRCPMDGGQRNGAWDRRGGAQGSPPRRGDDGGGPRLRRGRGVPS